MGMKEDFLKRGLSGYLLRRVPPRGLETKPQALEAELQALLSCVLRFAPREGYAEWWAQMETRIAEDAQTRAYPTEGEIKKAAMAIKPPKISLIAEADDIDSLKIISDKMNAGEPVGDGSFYGRLAVDIKARGLVSEQTFRAYRSAWYFKAKQVYGQEKALRIEGELKSRHEAAEAVARDSARYSTPEFPDKRMKGATA